MLVLPRVHVVPQQVGGLPQFGLESQGAPVLLVTVTCPGLVAPIGLPCLALSPGGLTYRRTILLLPHDAGHQHRLLLALVGQVQSLADFFQRRPLEHSQDIRQRGLPGPGQPRHKLVVDPPVCYLHLEVVHQLLEVIPVQ